MDGIVCSETPLISPGNCLFLIHKSPLGNFIVLCHFILLEILDWSRGEGLMQADLIRILPGSLNEIWNKKWQFLLDVESCMTGTLRSTGYCTPSRRQSLCSHWEWIKHPVASMQARMRAGCYLASGSSVAQLCASSSYTVSSFTFLWTPWTNKPPLSLLRSLRTKRVLSNMTIKIYLTKN